MVRNLIRKKCGEFRFFSITGLKLVEDVQQVHFHVAFLNSGGGQGPQGGKILGQARGRNNAHQFLGAGVPQCFKSELNHGVQLGESANGSQRERNFNPKTEFAVFNRAVGQRAVLPVARGIGVAGCLYGPKVIARR